MRFRVRLTRFDIGLRPSWNPPRRVVVHHDISDPAAAPLCELLNDLPFAFNGQSFAQVRRSYHERRDSERSCHHAPLDRFDDDVTF